jgi:DNA repair photolyase
MMIDTTTKILEPIADIKPLMRTVQNDLFTSSSVSKTSYLYTANENDEQSSIKIKVITTKSNKLYTKVVHPSHGLAYNMEYYKSYDQLNLVQTLKTKNISEDENGIYINEGAIIANEQAPMLLIKSLSQADWVCAPLIMDGAIDCYHPVEAELKITRQILQICLKYKHPLSITTSSSLILRDLELLKSLHELKLLDLNISISSLNDNLRQFMEPQASPIAQRLKLIKQLTNGGLQIRVTAFPIIPGLNDDDILSMAKNVSEIGVSNFHHEVVDFDQKMIQSMNTWIRTNKVNKTSKNEMLFTTVESLIAERIEMNSNKNTPSAEPKIKMMVQKQIDLAKKIFMLDDQPIKLNTELFKVKNGLQLSLF